MSEQGTPPAGARPARPPGAVPAKKAASRPPGQRPPSGDDGPASTTAVALIVATVLIGLLVFAKGVQRDTEVGTTASPTTTVNPSVTTIDRNAAPSTTRPEQAGTITTPPSTRAPAEVKVYVLNSADPAKTLAGPMAEALTGLGYTVVGRNDGPVAATSQVFYAPGYEGDAKEIARQIGFGTSAAAELPANPSFTVPPGSNVVVSIGKDKAEDVESGLIGGATGTSSGSGSGTSTNATTTTSLSGTSR